MILATRSFVCPKTGRVCNVYSTYCRERCLQVAGQVDVIRAGKGAGRGAAGTARPQPVVRRAGGKREGSARPPGARSPGSRLRWEGRKRIKDPDLYTVVGGSSANPLMRVLCVCVHALSCI